MRGSGTKNPAAAVAGQRQEKGFFQNEIGGGFIGQIGSCPCPAVTVSLFNKPRL